ncbi:ABC transporter substrate-binding protein [Deinococcus yavapaiensis]|uniref:ABC-type Fe3+ transport system substrate-binding protein n=1 Tax=Deinococcus yavapaiensis KR-236 TaxID=694435 RepID=A0A318SG11_9DEIO|nr:ABC transporter substrate-binding protein [Deinococcus yavapaiensis]PYE48356.1 ABC-type Fe3+ transport system substrate-binding protein [Deinococcus yavapaiensis KR-236]
MTRALIHLTSILLLSSTAALAQVAPNARVERDGEGRTLPELYQAALKEGGTLEVLAGGDEVNQQDATVQAFKAAFPGVNIKVTVDLSKYHEGRIDQQLASKNVSTDVALLQTLHNFDRWKSQGALLPYKPVGWNQVPAKFKDVSGAYTGMLIYSFSNVSNVAATPADQAPLDAIDYLDPKWKGKIVLVYPNDDDAVLYQFYKIIQKYGWTYMDRLLAQDVRWVRGSATPIPTLLQEPGTVSFTTAFPLVPVPNLPLRFNVPRTDSFLTWAQTAAIFKDAKHPAAAKLFLSFLLSKEFQANAPFWPIRNDLPAPQGWKPLSEYNTNHTDFKAFMRDRATVERFRLQIERYIGTPQGPSPLVDGR